MNRGAAGQRNTVATWLHSLAGGIVAVTAAVAVLAVLVTGLVAFPLIRAAAVEQASTQLVRQADAFAATPVASQALDLRERHLLGPDSYELSTISRDGTVSGVAGSLLSAADVQQVLDGGRVSRTSTSGGSDVLVQARMLRRGGGIVLTRSLVDVNAASVQVLQRTLLALAVGLVIALLGGTLLARRLASPLVATAAAARRMAGGERSVRVNPAGVTEVRAVGEAVNMLDHALLASEKRQREFLLSISHEIRTPLTALRGYAEAMVDGLVPAADIAVVGQTLAAETARLDGFVKELLELARLEADDFILEEQPVDIAVLLGQVEAAWRGAAVASGIRLQLRLPELGAGNDLMAVTDGQRLRQMIDGLVGNALRVTPAGEPLVLQARVLPSAAVEGPWGPAGELVAIDVVDSGPGLTKEDAAVAFERGVLYRRYLGQRPVGSGLGLSIAARLAERLGVRLTAEPQGPRGGARFCLLLPRAVMPGGTCLARRGRDDPSTGAGDS